MLAITFSLEIKVLISILSCSSVVLNCLLIKAIVTVLWQAYDDFQHSHDILLLLAALFLNSSLEIIPASPVEFGRGGR